MDGHESPLQVIVRFYVKGEGKYYLQYHTECVFYLVSR